MVGSRSSLVWMCVKRFVNTVIYHLQSSQRGFIVLIYSNGTADVGGRCAVSQASGPPLRARYAFTIDILIAGPVGLLLDDANCIFACVEGKKKSFSTSEVATFHHALLSQDER